MTITSNERRDRKESNKFTTDYRPTFNEYQIGYYLNVELCISIIFIFEPHTLLLREVMKKKPRGNKTQQL